MTRSKRKSRRTGPKLPLAGMRQIATMMKSKTFHGSLKKSSGRGEWAMSLSAISMMKISRTSRSSVFKRVWWASRVGWWVSMPTRSPAKTMRPMMNLLKSEDETICWESFFTAGEIVERR